MLTHVVDGRPDLATSSFLTPHTCTKQNNVGLCAHEVCKQSLSLLTITTHSLNKHKVTFSHFPHHSRQNIMCCTAGDWLQGPYVYALYEYYGYDVKDIGRLFIAGFGSSMVVGTVVGALADK